MRSKVFFLIFLIFNISSSSIINVHANPETEYLYVDGFNDVLREWDETGSSPWLDDDITNEVYTNVDNEEHEEFTYADSSGSGTINSVTLYIELNGPSARNDDFIARIWHGTAWLIVMNVDPDGDAYEWWYTDVSYQLDTWARIDSAKLKIKFSKTGSPATQNIYARRSYLLVDYTPAGVNEPVNDECILSDFDDADNLYAERKYYSLEYDGHDDDGYANIDYILVNITQGSTLRASFKYDEDTNNFSVIYGDWEIDSGGSSATRSGIYINATFKVFPSWDAIEESDFDINATIVDAESNFDLDWLQTDYGDVINTLLTDSIECVDGNDPDRVPLGVSIATNFGVRYANDPGSGTASTFYPPDAEFTGISIYDSSNNNEGTDSSITNGDGSVSWYESSVQTEDYNLYVDIDDADYTDGELTDKTETIIWDRILFYYFINDEADNRTDINDNIEIRIRGLLEFDDHELVSGDSVSVNSSSLNWDAVNLWFDGSFSESIVGNYSYVVDSANEVSYSINVYNQNVSNPFCIFDRIEIFWNVNDTTPDNGETVNFTLEIIRYDFDEVDLLGFTFDIVRNGSLWINDYTFNNFTDSNSDVLYNYTLNDWTESNYGLTVFFLNVTTYNITWSLEIVYPDAPDLLFGAGFNSSQGFILLYWNHSGIYVTDYELQNSTDAVSWSSLAYPSIPEYNDTSLELMNGTYRNYRVRARNLISGNYYNSSWSDINLEKVHFLKGVVDGAVTLIESDAPWIALAIILSIIAGLLFTGMKR